MSRPDSGARPPRWAEAWLAALLGETDRESMLGELGELYDIRCARHGVRAARRWYVRQVVVFTGKLLRYGRRRSVREARGDLERAMRSGETRGGGVDMSRWTTELTQAVRRLARAKVFTGIAVLTIGVGIGAFTSIFSLVEAVLLEPMPYEDPGELAWVWRDYVEADFPRGWLGGPDLTALEEQSDVFEGVAAVRTGQITLSGVDGGDPIQITANAASWDLLPVLGVEPALGRSFRAEEDVEGGPAVALLGHDLWRTRFAADPGVLDRTVLLDDELTRIVGIAPEHFRFAKHGSLSDPVVADIYVPLQMDLASQSPGSGAFAGLVRIAPDASPDRVEAALVAAAEPANVFFAEVGASPIRLWTIDLEEDLTAAVRPALLALVASAAFLLLILSANLTTLLLSRAAVREHELGIRMALGARRGRILSSVVAELGVAAALGAALGAALAFFGTDLVVALAPDDLPRIGAVALDGSVLAVALGVTAGMALLAGATPALQAARTDVVGATKEAGPRSGGSRRRTRTRSALVVAQVALSVMLLVGAGVTAQAFQALLRQDPGFDPGSTLTFDVSLPESRYEGQPSRAFHDALERRIASLPGVERVGAVTALPLTQLTNQQSVHFPTAPGNTGDPQADEPLIDWFRATPGYFESGGLRVLDGRGFVEADADTTTFNIVIDDVLAARFFPSSSAVGRRARFFGRDATVVGVVDQPHLYNVYEDDRPQVYIPFQRFPTESLSYAVRTGVDPVSLLPGVRAAVQELDRTVPLSQVRTLEDIVDASLGRERLSLTLVAAFALAALLLASLGIYGVVANTVVRRTGEIGVRMALGASADRVLSGVLLQGLRLTVAGAVLGSIGAVLSARVVESVMVGVQPRDPLVYGAVIAGLVATAVLACYLPARRATRIDPVEALRR